MSASIPGRVIQEATVEAGRPWGARVKKGDVLRIVDIDNAERVAGIWDTNGPGLVGAINRVRARGTR